MCSTSSTEKKGSRLIESPGLDEKGNLPSMMYTIGRCQCQAVAINKETNAFLDGGLAVHLIYLTQLRRIFNPNRTPSTQQRDHKARRLQNLRVDFVARKHIQHNTKPFSPAFFIVATVKFRWRYVSDPPPPNHQWAACSFKRRCVQVSHAEEILCCMMRSKTLPEIICKTTH